MKTGIDNSIFIAMAFALVLSSCSPRVTSHLNSPYGPLAKDETVSVLPVGSEVPGAAERLGDVAVNDSGFTSSKNGTYDAVIDLATQEARQAGGNVLLLTEHRRPDYVSSIHRIKADVYHAVAADSLLPAMTSPEEAAAPADSVTTETVPAAEIVPAKPAKTFMLGIWGGGGYRTNRLDPQLTGADRAYASALKWGYDFGADALCYFSDWGLGLRYSSLQSHHNGQASYTTGGKSRVGEMDSRSNIWFLGPTLALRDTYGTKGNSLYVIYGLGYLGYKLKSEVPSYYPTTVTGGTGGCFIDLGADFRLTERAFFSVALSYYVGVLSRFNVNNGNTTRTIELEDDEREGLNYLALNFGLHWYLVKK